MNKLKTLLLSVAFLTTAMTANAAGVDSLIQKSELNKTSTIAVSVKDAKSGKVIYEYNQNKLMNPASVQKVFTMRSAYKQLGENYTFKTAAYVDKQGNLYIKLGGDPTLSKGSLTTLLKSFKEKYNKPVNDIVIDPTIHDNKQWGIGWMWDDDTNSLLPKYSPFSINENKIELSLTPGKNGSNPEIKNRSSYPMNVINMLKNGSSNSLTFDRTPWVTSDMTYVSGSIKTPVNILIPIDSPERYFTGELGAALKSASIKFNGCLKVAPMPSELTKIAEISSTPLDEIMGTTLKNSNNFYSEMIFKTAGGNYVKGQGTTAKAIDMFEKYYSDIKPDGHIVVDGCGISRNDLMSADWITNALNKIYNEDDFNNFVILLPKPIEGTLSDRLLDISLKLRAKTGTASGVSSIAGYVDTKSNKKYSFAIIIQNYSINTNEVKKFEDSIINEIYKL